MTNQPKTEVKGIEQFRQARRVSFNHEGYDGHLTYYYEEADYRNLFAFAEEQDARIKAMEEVVKAMVSDDAFAELCQGIGDEPKWLKDARVVLGRDAASKLQSPPVEETHG
jgi:hypothetical protein